MPSWKLSCVVLSACVLCACPGPSGNDGGTGGGAGAEDSGTDAGVDCATVARDPALGTLALRNGATVTGSAALPSGYATVGAVGGQLYALSWNNQLSLLGTFPTLAAGAPFDFVDPVDVNDGGLTFASSFVAARGTQVAVGYTRSDFGGQVVVLETADGGVQRFEAPGNFSMAALGGAWLVNGLGFDTHVGAGLYVMDDAGVYPLATFPAGASSGYVTVLGDGTLVAGYADGNYVNHLHAVPDSTYGASMTARAPFALGDAVELFFGADYVSGVVAAGDALVLARNGAGSFTPTRVEVLPLDGGAPVALLERPDVCTSIDFVAGGADAVWVGVTDRDGARLLKVRP